MASRIIIALYTQNLFFEYATKYRATHEAIAKARSFSLTDTEYDDFVKFVMAQSDFKYTTQSEYLLEELKKTAEKEGYYPAFEAEYTVMKQQLEKDKKQDWVKNKREIKQLLEQEICAHYYLNTGRIESTIQEDKDVLKAIEVLKNPAERQAILQAKK